MDASTLTFFAIVAILGANQVVMRVPALRRYGFGVIQLLDLGIGGAVLIFGLPGFEHVPVISYVFGLLCMFHAAQNFSLHSQLKAEEEKEARLEARREELSRLNAESD